MKKIVVVTKDFDKAARKYNVPGLAVIARTLSAEGIDIESVEIEIVEDPEPPTQKELFSV